MRKFKWSNRLYYGWYITVALAFTETISWGIVYYAFSVFITPMETDLHWSRTELTAGFSLALLITGAMAFPVGSWIDRHGSRFLMTTGSILASLLIIAWSRVTDRTTFYLIWAGLGVCAATILYEPAFAVVAAWFTRQRGKALAIITFAGGLASTIFVPLSDALRRTVGWRDAIFILGVFLALTTIPLHLLVLRRRPVDLGLMPDGGKIVGDLRPVTTGKSLSHALHSRFFWLLTFAFSLASLAAAAIRVHFIPFLTGTGVDPSTAAVASGSIGFMQVAGRVVFAPLEKRLSIRTMIIGIFALQAISMLVLILGTSTWMIGLFIVIFGASYGAETLARTTALADQFGSAHYGRISSIMAIFLTLASTSAPVGAGLVYDQFGTYLPVLWALLVLVLCSTGIMLFARPEVDKPIELEGTVSNVPTEVVTEIPT